MIPTTIQAMMVMLFLNPARREFRATRLVLSKCLGFIWALLYEHTPSTWLSRYEMAPTGLICHACLCFSMGASGSSTRSPARALKKPLFVSLRDQQSTKAPRA